LPLRFYQYRFLDAHDFDRRTIRVDGFSQPAVCCRIDLRGGGSAADLQLFFWPRSATVPLATFFRVAGFYLCAKAALSDEQQRHARWSWIGVVAGLAILRSSMPSVSFAPPD